MVLTSPTAGLPSLMVRQSQPPGLCIVITRIQADEFVLPPVACLCGVPQSPVRRTGTRPQAETRALRSPWVVVLVAVLRGRSAVSLRHCTSPDDSQHDSIT